MTDASERKRLGVQICRVLAIMQIIHEHHICTLKEVSEAFGGDYSDRTIQRDLDVLVELEIAKRIIGGHGNHAARYTLQLDKVAAITARIRKLGKDK